jgi:hypothetical protein
MSPSLKVRGRMFACMASHKSAEPDTLVVMTDVTPAISSPVRTAS